eukprot:398121-Amphidinium_carterae.2
MVAEPLVQQRSRRQYSTAHRGLTRSSGSHEEPLRRLCSRSAESRHVGFQAPPESQSVASTKKHTTEGADPTASAAEVFQSASTRGRHVGYLWFYYL